MKIVSVLVAVLAGFALPALAANPICQTNGNGVCVPANVSVLEISNYTVVTTDVAVWLGADGSGSITFKLPNPGTAVGNVYKFYDVTLHGYVLTTVGGTANLGGNFAGAAATSQTMGAKSIVKCRDDSTDYICEVP